jgi:hypothetical protein
MRVTLPAPLGTNAVPRAPAREKSVFKTYAGGRVALLLLVIGLAAFVLRVAVVIFHPQSGHWFHQDTIYYLENADSILRTGLPTLNKAPLGFSYILCVLLQLGFSLKAIAYIIQPLAGAFDCLLVFFVCRGFGHPRAGLVGAAFCAVHPSLINSSSQLLSEEWAMLFVLLGLVAWLSDRKGAPFAAGLLLGFACAIRSPCLAALVALILWSLRSSHARNFRRTGLLALGAAIPILVVSIHLGLASHTPVFLTLQSSEADTVIPVWGGYETLTPEEHLQRGSYFEFAWHHPAQFAQERMKSFLTFASPWPFGDDRPLLRKWIMCASDGSVLLASLTSAFILWRRDPSSRWFVLAWLPCCVCLFYTLFFSNPRYRVPTLPLLASFSALVLVPKRTKDPEPGPLQSGS